MNLENTFEPMEIGDELEAGMFNTFIYPTVHSASSWKTNQKAPT